MRYLENKVKDKQLEVIADFVKQIQQTDFIYIDFITQDNSKTKPIPIGIVTLFDIPEIEGFEEYNELCFSESYFLVIQRSLFISTCCS